MMKVLVATDGSENSKRALLEAKNYVHGKEAEVTIITVVNPFLLGPYLKDESSEPPNSQKIKEKCQKLLDDSKKVFEGFEGEVRTEMRYGDPGDEILKEARAYDYDILILGSRGQGTISRAVLGSVSHKVLNNTKKNILIVK